MFEPDSSVSGSSSSPVAALRQAKLVFSTVPLYVAFAATGVCVALPGAVLPVLLTRWHLQDRGAGTLFFLSFIASSLGALLPYVSMLRALILGSTLVALGSVGLSICHASFARVCISTYGLGLGITMTVITLLLQQYDPDSGKALVRLNLLWAAGASLCPVLALHTLRSGDLRTLLYPLALGFGLLAVWSAFQVLRRKEIEAEREEDQPNSLIGRTAAFFREMPVVLIVMVMLITGVEASAGGWLATYAERGGDGSSQIVAAPTCLWTGLLLSRLFWSFSRHVRAERWVVRGSLLLMVGAAVVLLTSRHGVPFFAAAVCLGFGLGPAYPLLLSRALRIYASGTIFFLAGVGSACLPWLTGFVSSQRGTLHAGFFVPALATAVMFVLSFSRVLEREKA